MLPTNRIFKREQIASDIAAIIEQITQYTLNPSSSDAPKKGIYIYGPSGVGKTHFVLNLLKSLNYDTIEYNASDIRNKALFQTIDDSNLATNNVYDLFFAKRTKIAIMMDEIDGMSSGDKGGIDALIRLVRQKKTKKQRTETTTLNPIICIGNHKTDKKIRELMKACHVFELPAPTNTQIIELLRDTIPVFNDFPPDTQAQMLAYIQCDMNKFKFLHRVWVENPTMLTIEFIHDVFQVKVSNEDTKTITCRLLNEPYPLEDHAQFMNETDRTTVALLWHENVGRALTRKIPVNSNQSDLVSTTYINILNNICFADYIGRITFQNQIWQFNEMCSLVKTFYNNRLLHDLTTDGIPFVWQPSDVEFTKVLTKYSTEFNNQGFIYGLCQQMNMDQSDLFALFIELKMLMLMDQSTEVSTNNNDTTTKSKNKPNANSRSKKATNVTIYSGIKFGDTEIKIWLQKVHNALSHYNVELLDIKRMYRFLDIVDKTTTTEDVSLYMDSDDFNDSDTEN